jgi:hypothetical protein
MTGRLYAHLSQEEMKQ